MRRDPLLWLGTILAAVILGLGAAGVWTLLLHREAIQYGVLLTERLRAVVQRIDIATRQTFTPEYYHRLHRQPLLHMTLEEDATWQEYIRTLAPIIQNPVGGGAIFTDCRRDNLAECYSDFLFGLPNVRTLKNYDPKGRPWFTLTRDHTDWVALTFLPDKKSVPGYPKIPAIGFAKRILIDPTGESDEGIWVVVITPHVTEPQQRETFVSSPLLDMLFEGQRPPIQRLDAAFTILTFPAAVLSTEARLAPACRGITSGLGMTYEASVDCRINEASIHYVFTKRYDRPIVLRAIFLVALVLLFAVHWWLWGLVRLRRRHAQATLALERGRLATAVGARLVHDLKKGILFELNKLETVSADDLAYHRKYLRLLTKYVNLLGSNLRREREPSWIPFTPEALRSYSALIFGTDGIWTTGALTANTFLEITYADQLTIRSATNWPPFAVPEMALYRMMKNIVENYTVHGTGALRIGMRARDDLIVIEATNAIAVGHAPPSDATGLGISIIHQLLEDNFGAAARVEQQQRSDRYTLTLTIPQRMVHP